MTGRSQSCCVALCRAEPSVVLVLRVALRSGAERSYCSAHVQRRRESFAPLIASEHATANASEVSS